METATDTPESPPKAAPPYFAFRTLLNTLEDMKKRAIPNRIDRLLTFHVTASPLFRDVLAQSLDQRGEQLRRPNDPQEVFIAILRAIEGVNAALFRLADEIDELKARLGE